ncbi:hypothetical protein ABK040_008211 [Willaertia magna]
MRRNVLKLLLSNNKSLMLKSSNLKVNFLKYNLKCNNNYHSSLFNNNPDGRTSVFKNKTKEEWIDFFKKRQHYGIIGHLDFEIVDIPNEGELIAQINVSEKHMAANGYTHAASIVFLADTSCGFGCFCNLPTSNHLFTTIELKSNFVSTTKVGHKAVCRAKLLHAGKSTQVWDALVYEDKLDGKLMATFRCTQMVLEPRHKAKTVPHNTLSDNK